MQSDESLDWHRHGNTGGLRADSEVEKVLRVAHSFIKTNSTLITVFFPAKLAKEAKNKALTQLDPRTFSGKALGTISYTLNGGSWARVRISDITFGHVIQFIFFCH